MTNTTLDKEPVLSIQYMLDGSEDEFIVAHLAECNDDEPVANSELTTDESELLASLETEIGYGINEFNTIGACLYQIKSKKLYRSTHTTFASYCKDKFQISRVHGDRLVSAFETQEFLKSEPIGSVVIPKVKTPTSASRTTKAKIMKNLW